MRDLSVCLTALYLRGAPREVEARRTGWPDVVRLLRRAGCEAGRAAEALRDSGLWPEAIVLESPGLISWAADRVDREQVLTVADGEYPSRWRRVMGKSAPPALWRLGEVPTLPSLSIVGSRIISGSVRQFCHATAKEAALLGFAIVSGRAEGCDLAAAKGARSVGAGVMEILPHGISLVRFPHTGCLLSVTAPDEPFSAAAAMERNALIYAASSHTVIGAARFKEGGTWTGAIHALRSRYSTLIVRRSDDLASKSLVALGGVWLDESSDLAKALKSPVVQPELFGNAV